MRVAKLRTERPRLVNVSTARAIYLGRFLCVLPHFGMLTTIMAWEIMPPMGAQSTFVQPIKYTLLLSGGVFYWWGVFLGAFCHFISLLIQAFGKRPEYTKEGYPEGTDKIYSCDAIIELLALVTSCLAANMAPVWVEPNATVGYKVITTFFTVFAFFFGTSACALTTRTIINSCRDALSPRNFQSWSIRTAREMTWISIFTTLFMVYASLVMQSQDLPTYCKCRVISSSSYCIAISISSVFASASA